MSNPEHKQPGWGFEQEVFTASRNEFIELERVERLAEFGALHQRIDFLEQMGEDHGGRSSYHELLEQDGDVTRQILFTMSAGPPTGRMAIIIINDVERDMQLNTIIRMSEYVVPRLISPRRKPLQLISKSSDVLLRDRHGEYVDINDIVAPHVYVRGGKVCVFEGKNYQLPVADPNEPRTGMDYVNILNRRTAAQELNDVLYKLTPDTTKQDIDIAYNPDNSWR